MRYALVDVLIPNGNIVKDRRRQRLPDERKSITKKFEIYGLNEDGEPHVYEGYVTAGMYEDGRVGEVFVRFAKLGGREGRLLDACATLMSICLQSGVPLRTIIDKFSFQRFEPSGFTNDSTIRTCFSPLDYIVRWLDLKFGDGESTNGTSDSPPPIMDDLVNDNGNDSTD